MLNSFHPALGFSLAPIIFYKITDNETRKTGLARASRCCRQSKMHNLHPQSGLDIPQIVFTFILTKQLSAARRHLATPSAFMNFPIHLISSKHDRKSYRKKCGNTRYIAIHAPRLQASSTRSNKSLLHHVSGWHPGEFNYEPVNANFHGHNQLISIVSHDAAQNISMLHSPNPFSVATNHFVEIY